MYTPLALLHCGCAIGGTRGYLPNTELDEEARRSRNSQLRFAILYPALYCVLIMPLSIVRWITFKKEAETGETPRWPVASFIVITIFAAAGVFNALLYRFTRSNFFQQAQ